MPQLPPGVHANHTASGTTYRVKAYDPALKKSRWIGTYPTVAEAKAAKRKFESRPRARGRATVSNYHERWLELHPRPKQSTHDTYRYAIKPFIRDFGNRRLDSIDRYEAREWAQDKPLATTDTARVFFNDAIDDGLCTHNPFARLRRRRSRGRKDLVPISTEGLEALAAIPTALRGPEFGGLLAALIKFAANSAMRPSEIFALKWGCIDFAAKEIHVLGQLDKRGRFQTTKNHNQRVIVLLPGAEAALRGLARRIDVDRIFSTVRDTCFTDSKWHYYWDPIRCAYGEPEMDFYELRHYCATLMLEQGLAPGDVAVQLGHTDGGKKVMEVYGHPSEDRARDRIRRAFDGNVVPIEAPRSGRIRSIKTEEAR